MTCDLVQNSFLIFILRFLAGLSLYLVTTVALGQDLIVTNKGDSIHCRITEIKPDHIRYEHVEDDEVAKAFIPAAWVVTYTQNFYPYSEIELWHVEQQQKAEEERIEEVKEAEVRKQKKGGTNVSFLMSAGWSKRIAGLKNKDYDDQTLAYARALQSGWNIGMDLRFPVTLGNGFGLKYSAFYSAHADDFVIYVPPVGPPTTTNIKSTVMIHYFAPTFNATLPNADTTRAVMLGFGIGYMRYKEHTGVEPPITATGNHFGFCIDLGYDFGLKKATSPFVRFSLYIGNIVSAKVEQGSNTVSGKLRIPENLSRVDISVGVRLNEKDKSERQQ